MGQMGNAVFRDMHGHSYPGVSVNVNSSKYNLPLFGELLLDHPEHLVPVNAGPASHGGKALFQKPLGIPLQRLLGLLVRGKRFPDGLHELPPFLFHRNQLGGEQVIENFIGKAKYLVVLKVHEHLPMKRDGSSLYPNGLVLQYRIDVHQLTLWPLTDINVTIRNHGGAMLIVMHHKAGTKQIEAVTRAVTALGFTAAPIPGSERTAIGVLGNKGYVDDSTIRTLPGVQEVIHVSKPYKLVSRDFHPRPTIVRVGGVEIGEGRCPVVAAGPCAVESEEQILKTARAVKKAGADLLRGGAFKPRTGPHTFQGLREEGLRLLAMAGRETGLPIVTEVMSPDTVGLVAEHADLLQVGARNMQNFDLLREVGRAKRPVLLKRGMSATLEEFLAAAEYILAEGNHQVILCERGIRTFETATRNTLDLAIVPLAKELSHLPIMVDPSHATGKRSLVAPMAKASLIAGAHGVLVEVHPEPEKALSDGPQSLTFQGFAHLMDEVARIKDFLGSA